ncbi:MAG TPA: PAS domain S-box protein [Candidatus Eremiobacteraeota bacterium]|nr:PAS domain S-box protein [Candidatus Eremiobacteraeota bacterium]
MEETSLTILLREEEDQKNKVFSKLLELKGENLKNLAYDYTYWDEIVTFVKTGDEFWATHNLDTILELYSCNFVWIYNLTPELVYSVNNLENSKLKEIPLPEGSIVKVLKKPRFCHFFLNTSEGLIEIRGATIHPLTDKEKKTPPRGYFLVGRLWDKDNINELSVLSGSKIEITPFSGENNYKSNPKEGIINFSKILYGWNKEPLMTIHIHSQSAIINKFNYASDKNFLIIITFFFILLVLLYTLITLWIRIPMDNITRSLNTDNPKFLKDLNKKRDEFGDISKLICQFFEQKKKLLYEVEERKKATEELQKEIEEHKKTEILLRTSEKELRHLLEVAQEGVWVTDNEGKTILINPKMAEILGYTVEELIGKPYSFFISKDKIENYKLNIEKYKTEFKELYVTELIHKSGKKIHTSLAISPTTDEEGNYTGNLSLVTDITEQKLTEEEKRRLENQLRQSDKIRAIGTMASGIAHDFNNILVAILGYTESMLLRSPRDRIMQNNLTEIRNAAQRAINLIRQILTFSRKSEVKRMPLQIEPIVKETLKLIKRLLPPSIEIKENIKSDLVWIMADPTQIQQILINLCTNAAQSMNKKTGSIEVTLDNLNIDCTNTDLYKNIKPGIYLRLTVSDTGVGMSPEILERIFEPYFTTKKTGEGSGMGLSVIHGIVNTYGGEITVESEVDKGTVFNIFLPSIELDNELRDNEGEKIPFKTGEKILFVDDEEEPVVRIIQQLLEQMGYEIIIKRSSTDALSMFYKEPDEFSLIIADELMPKMRGTQMAEEILRIKPNMPVIIITGYGELINIEKVKAMGIREVLIKPLTLENLVNVIRKILNEEYNKSSI